MSPSLIEKLSDRQVVAEARAVAKGFCYSEPVATRIFDHQGMFSKTAIATLEDGSEVIVQLKDNEIDTTKTALARGLLGEIVPFIFSAKTTKAHYAYVADLIKGTMWAGADTTAEQDIGLASQLGAILPRCLINTDSSGVVDFFIVPRLKRILSKEDITHAPLKSKIEMLLSKCDVLKHLPLALCHIDINARNVLLNEKMKIAGIVDWEQAALLPLGSNAWCMRYLSVPIVRGKDIVSENTQPMAAAFWQSFLAGIPARLRLHGRKIIVAMQVGFIMSVYFGGGAPDTDELPSIFERLDWLETTFGPMCSDR
ncbi:hypothetical protein DFH11DRAFT_1508209 [Phellopilus nigrolimitatus]|nr:hypothetical protein DFH11DRAFT_1508209 [Phellopilus nigrolimitatus]